MRRLIKGMLPKRVQRVIGRAIAESRARRLAKLSVADAFDEIYRRGYWRQGDSDSGVGSEGDWLEQYASLVRDLVSAFALKTAVDAGCGDFNVGKELAPSFREYKALDVSNVIIAKNKAKFGELKHVEFAVCNLIDDAIPKADIVMVRQVFQHLTNRQISRILENIESSGARYLMVAEEQPIGGRFSPNIDLDSHSVLTRLESASAVDITASPFGKQAKLIGRFPAGGKDATTALAVYLAELSCARVATPVRDAANRAHSIS